MSTVEAKEKVREAQSADWIRDLPEEQAIEKLEAAGINSKDFADSSGNSLLDHAKTNGKAKIVSFLLAKGFSVFDLYEDSYRIFEKDDALSGIIVSFEKWLFLQLTHHFQTDEKSLTENLRRLKVHPLGCLCFASHILESRAARKGIPSIGEPISFE